MGLVSYQQFIFSQNIAVFVPSPEQVINVSQQSRAAVAQLSAGQVCHMALNPGGLCWRVAPALLVITC